MRKYFVLSILTLLTLSSFIFAITLLKTTVEELTQESNLIILGTVQEVECRWENRVQGTINTFITVNVFDYLKGTDDSRVVVKQLGGQIGDWGDVISGTPVLRKGDEVILFLVENKESYEIHSIALGLFRVYSNDLGEKMVINDLRNVNLIDPVTGNQVEADEANPSFTLFTFLNQVRSYLSD
ncbi:MAG: hypothetical protein GQ561_06300 [Calditrichae bacterium]|nr:hypothetical protein [Calditrichia bacterium]